MADDEAATLRALNESRDLFRKRVEIHGGRLIDTAGDSVLAEFPSAVEAVDCAVEIQHELVKRNAQLAEHRRMQFRIGINLGDVIEQGDGTIYGDGVNVAARLQQLAEAGECAYPVPRLTRSRASCRYSSSRLASNR
jgi:class 3 adenylate cyclase